MLIFNLDKMLSDQLHLGVPIICWRPRDCDKFEMRLYSEGHFSIHTKYTTETKFHRIVAWIDSHLNEYDVDCRYSRKVRFTRTMLIKDSTSLDEVFQEVYYHIESVDITANEKVFRYEKERVMGRDFGNVCSYIYCIMTNNTLIPDIILKEIKCFSFALLPKVDAYDLCKYMSIKRVKYLYYVLSISQKNLRELQNYRFFCQKKLVRRIKSLQLHVQLLKDFDVDEPCVKCDKVVYNSSDEATEYKTPRFMCTHCMRRLHVVCYKQMKKAKQEVCLHCGNELRLM